ncbi:unnamed protein product [Prunus armeniaca]
MKKLEFLVKLYQAKCLLGSTDKGMDIMLKLVKSILPDGETLPNNFYDVKQLIKDLALIFVKVYSRSHVVACKGLMAVDQGLFPIDVQDWRRFEHGTTPGDAWKRIKRSDGIALMTGLAKNSGGYWCNIGRLVQRRNDRSQINVIVRSAGCTTQRGQNHMPK